MSKEIIPQQTKVTCDICKCICDRSTSKKDAHLTLSRSALDYLGDPCADATVKMDLCDQCETNVSEAINRLAKHYA